jgi:hypothetical protein
MNQTERKAHNIRVTMIISPTIQMTANEALLDWFLNKQKIIRTFINRSIVKNFTFYIVNKSYHN